MTAALLPNVATCPAWCSRTCHEDDEALHIQADVVLAEIGPEEPSPVRLALARDDDLGSHTFVWIDDQPYDLDLAERIGKELTRLVHLGRNS
jgi:hypothetical protein